MTFSTILKHVRNGKMLIIVDDEGRENEGDIFVAAQKVTPEVINFMATHARGLICMPITKKRAQKLDISLMVANDKNTEKEKCKFGISIDAKNGTTTGISAFDRSHTIKKVLDENSKSEDFNKPGHIFPLLAEDKGTLVRQGHTEAAVDLAKLAGLKPAGVICEIMNEDGTMAHGNDLIEFANKHHLPIVNIKEIVLYRMMHEKIAEKQVDVSLPTYHGAFQLHAYKNNITGQEDIALVKGEIKNKEDVLVRVHSECLTSEVFGSLRCDCDDQLQTALSVMEKAEQGILIYLRQEGRGIGLLNKLHAYKLQDQGKDTVDANTELGLSADARDYGVAAQILNDFEVKSIQLLSNNPEKVKQLEAYGVNVKKRLPIETMPCRHNIGYIETKQKRMGHLSNIREKLIFK